MPGNPQLENGYTRIATELLEALIRHRIPGEQMQCFLNIIRMTYGYQQKENLISLKQFQIATGLSRRSIQRALNILKKKHLIYIRKKADRSTVNYRINKIYSEWKVDVKKADIRKKADRVSAKKRIGCPQKSGQHIYNKDTFKDNFKDKEKPIYNFKFPNNPMLEQAYKILNLPGYTEKDFTDHCHAYGKDPDEIRRALADPRRESF